MALYAHTSPPARGERPLPKVLRQQINKHCHRLAVDFEAASRQQMLDQARKMLQDGLIVDDVVTALGIANSGTSQAV